MIYRIYCVTEKTSGKHYIGKTRLAVAGRWRQHCEQARHAPKMYIHRAIAKHGPFAFSIRQIFQTTSLSLANQQERYYIKKFETLRPRGYNLTSGGDGLSDPTGEISKRISESNKIAFRRPAVRAKIQRTWFGNGQRIPQARPDITTAHMIRLYRTGLGIRAIGRKVGMHHNGVWGCLRRAGFKMRTGYIPGRPKNATK